MRTKRLYRLQLVGGNVFFTFGLLGQIVYYIVKTIRDIVEKKIRPLGLILQIFIILMSMVLFSKYLNHTFGDYFALFIVPIFIGIALIYLFTQKIKFDHLTISTVLYLFLIIPFFGLEYRNIPRQYIPYEWYSKYHDVKSIGIDLPYGFQYKETEQLSIEAFKFRQAGRFYEAIHSYRKALEIEPQNPRILFDISECYARINDLKSALSSLDTAIIVDSHCAACYANRGLINYKLGFGAKAIQDYKKAIQMNFNETFIYENMALAYYSIGELDSTCQIIKKAEQLKVNFVDENLKEEMKKNSCK